MPTRFNWIRPLQEPFDYGLDGDGNSRWAFNVIAQKDPSHTFMEELVSVLQTAGVVGAFGSNVIAGAKASRPKTKAAVLHITESGGTNPEYIHNSLIPAFRNPTAQLVASADKAADARRMAFLAWDALAVVSNASVTPITLV